jgi:hypothetical protein
MTDGKPKILRLRIYDTRTIIHIYTLTNKIQKINTVLRSHNDNWIVKSTLCSDGKLSETCKKHKLSAMEYFSDHHRKEIIFSVTSSKHCTRN